MSRACQPLLRGLRRAALALGLGAALAAPAAAAQFEVYLLDAPGTGFLDPTPATPVGGNPGTTVGDQLFYVLATAADRWGSLLNSPVTITIGARAEELFCSETQATVAATGTPTVYRDFPGAPRSNTFYVRALTEKLLGAQISPIASINDLGMLVSVNSRIGKAGCLPGRGPVYLGLDGNAPAGKINLLSTLTHEIAHGLGFSTKTNQITGEQLLGYPSAYDWQVFDNTLGKEWPLLTAAQRATSSANYQRVVWRGGNVATDARGVLDAGRIELRVFGVLGFSGYDGAFEVTPIGAPFDPYTSYTANLFRLVDQANGTGLACSPLSAANRSKAAGRIVLVDRGTCLFIDKARNLAAAGALAVIIVDNQPVTPLIPVVAPDVPVSIPVLFTTQADGTALKNAVGSNQPIGQLATSLTRRKGTDRLGNVLLFTPSGVTTGSSVAHFDLSASPDLLMEPSGRGGPTDAINPAVPRDLTLSALRDLGW